jgi:hypothetical protein
MLSHCTVAADVRSMSSCLVGRPSVLLPAGAQGGAGGQPGRSNTHYHTVGQHLALPRIASFWSSDQVNAWTAW